MEVKKELLFQVSLEYVQREGSDEVDVVVVIMAGTREHARVLLPWNENAPYKQEIDEEVYKYYKDLLKFRREHQSIAYGEFRVLRDTKDLFTYERKLENESIIVDCNLNIKPKKAYKIKGEYREVFTSNATGNELNAYGIKFFENVLAIWG